MYPVGMYPDGGDVGMIKPRDKKTGQYLSTKKAPEIDTKNVIDIWCCEEPVENDDSDWPVDFTLKVLGMIFLFVSILYLIRRI